MNPIFLAQWMKEKRSPIIIIVFMSLSILVPVLLGSAFSSDSAMTIDVFSDVELSAEGTEEWLDQLNQTEAYVFELLDEQEARNKVSNGQRELAIQLFSDDYRIVASVDHTNLQAIEQYVNKVFMNELQLRYLTNELGHPDSIRDDIREGMEDAPIELQTSSIDGTALESYDMGQQLAIGFTLFMVMFTIGFKINAIADEKTSGLWNRVILSPLGKTKMYAGHLSYSTILGVVQIVTVFLCFLFLFDLNVAESPLKLLTLVVLYTLSMVALAMLFTSILKTPEQFNMVFPSVIPVIPLISGIYMPPGTITNSFILWIAELFPLAHAMEAIMSVLLYDASWNDLMSSIAKLLLLSTLYMGIGINLMERGKA
ncbi:ABC transporter permease [Alkalicoccobacillus porphyridii]|uniref:ABC transporter permease n=1 Tax=Alkalicoccobacillus porphyridii TaxID=2597270 RepID=A0A553ZXM2_9BACI|nr:ABC transporter permease [Alkalicoccobacillus porphyridii]TSB46192.1 ABC transporter permease [Alkalicoccobacillus porphyridii]